MSYLDQGTMSNLHSVIYMRMQKSDQSRSLFLMLIMEARGVEPLSEGNLPDQLPHLQADCTLTGTVGTRKYRHYRFLVIQCQYIPAPSAFLGNRK